MTDTNSEQSTNPGNLAQPLATGLHLLILLPILGLLLLAALWATVFYLLSDGRSEATVYVRSGLAGSILVVAFIALLMFQAHRLRKSALAAREFQALLDEGRNRYRVAPIISS